MSLIDILNPPRLGYYQNFSIFTQKREILKSTHLTWLESLYIDTHLNYHQIVGKRDGKTFSSKRTGSNRRQDIA